VILHGRWSILNRGRNEDPSEELFPIYQRAFNGSEELDAYYIERIRYTVDKLLAAGKRVIFVGPVPEIGIDVPDLLVRQAMKGENLSVTAKCEDFTRRHGYLLDALNSLEKRDGVLVILPHQRLMNGNDARISLEGKPLYRDDDHLSELGANYLQDLWRPIFVQNREGVATAPTQ
jgi:hypothetical protein